MDYILFDLDGTLTDSRLGITKALQHALEYMGIETSDIGSLTKFIGPPLREGLSMYGGLEGERLEQTILKYREYYSSTGLLENELYSGIDELLSSLHRAGKKLFVATSKPEIFAKIILEHFQLSKYFQDICGSTIDESRSKKQEVIQYALDQNGINDYTKVLMIGDRKHDVLGASGVGIASVGVLYGFGDRRELEEAGADRIVDKVTDLYDVIMNW